MAFVFHPLAASTIAFGNQTVGSSTQSTISAKWSSSPTQSGSIDSITFTGAGAAAYSFNDSGPGSVFYLDNYINGDTGSGFIVFSPTSATTFNATATIDYHNDSQALNFTYTLSGTGIGGGGGGGGPAGEAPALFSNFRELLVPSTGTTGIVLSYYNSAIFDDANDGSIYTYKSEDIIADRVPTLRRVIITYIDLGVATLTVNVASVNDVGAPVTGQAVVTIGTAGASGLLATAYADMSVTGYRPQITLIRAAGGGPIAISHVMATGTVEKAGTL